VVSEWARGAKRASQTRKIYEKNTPRELENTIKYGYSMQFVFARSGFYYEIHSAI
jgi:hypothetical protein